MSDHPPSTSGKRGWLDRVADLGNHRTLIAAATLLTILTGGAFIVDTIFGKKDELDVATLAAALSAAQTKAGLVAEELRSDAGDAGDARLEEIERVLLAQQQALDALADEAVEGDRTREEQERIIQALMDYSLGRPAETLAILGEIATEQASRGERRAAAETWTKRARLQQYSDPAGCTDDLGRAVALVPDELELRLEYCALLLRTNRAEVALNEYEAVANRARELGQPHVELRALSRLHERLTLLLAMRARTENATDLEVAAVDTMQESSDSETRALQLQRRNAAARILALSRAQGDVSPDDLEAVKQFSVSFAATYPTLFSENSESAGALLAELDTYRAALAPEHEEEAPDLFVVNLLSALDATRFGVLISTGQPDRALAMVDEIFQRESRRADLSGQDTNDIIDSAMRLMMAGGMRHFSGDVEGGLPSLERCAGILAEQESALSRPFLVGALQLCKQSHARLSDAEQAMAYNERIVDVYDRWDEQTGGNVDQYVVLRNAHIELGQSLLSQGEDLDRARELVRTARGIQNRIEQGDLLPGAGGPGEATPEILVTLEQELGVAVADSASMK